MTTRRLLADDEPMHGSVQVPGDDSEPVGISPVIANMKFQEVPEWAMLTSHCAKVCADVKMPAYLHD